MADEALTEHLRSADVASVTALSALLAPARPVRIVDVGANPIDDRPQYAALLAGGAAHVTGFEPQPEALARLRRLAGPDETYLPYAIGDGGRHELRICASDGFSSLFEPDERQLELLVDFPRLARVVDRLPVDTVRLDEVEEVNGLDYLKLDVQGSELSVIEGGRRLLADAGAVQVEVGFHRLYRGAPTFAEVDLALRSSGLVPQQFVSTRTWPLAPARWADPWQAEARQLVEGDLLYVRDLTTVGEWTVDQLNCLALVAHGAYRSVGVVVRVLTELIRRGDLPKDAVERYLALSGAATG